ncbi:hypothetical protein U1Q18_043526, partial [Sarracenia purpurea var. burkii]
TYIMERKSGHATNRAHKSGYATHRATEEGEVNVPPSQEGGANAMQEIFQAMQTLTKAVRKGIRPPEPRALVVM